MVITVTLNPAIDKTLNIENLVLGSVNRVSAIRHDIGGKGINVSKVLRNFNVDSICTGFLGGIWEDYFKKQLDARNINSRFVHIKESTRTNTKIVDTYNKIFTDINEAGPNIDVYELEKFIDIFKGLCNKEDIVVLSGGVSPSIPSNIYGQLIKIAKEKKAITILDAEGALLKEGIKEKPDIIKPNIHELNKLMNTEISSEKQVIEAARRLQKEGIKRILISLGEKGAVYITERGIYSTKGLNVSVKSTVGAGDSMVASLVYSLIKEFDDKYTLGFANACGAASVTLEGTEACTLSQVEELLDKVEVEMKEE